MTKIFFRCGMARSFAKSKLPPEINRISFCVFLLILPRNGIYGFKTRLQIFQSHDVFLNNEWFNVTSVNRSDEGSF